MFNFTSTQQEGSTFYKVEMNFGPTHYFLKIACGTMYLMLKHRRAGSARTHACGESLNSRRSRKLPPL